MENTVNGHQLLLKVKIGSQAYGTATPESDIDYKGIYLQNPEDLLMGKYKEQITIKKEVEQQGKIEIDDEVYYEIKRFMSLLASNNPTILEMLNTPEDCIVYKHPILDELFANREAFITKKCRNSFGGYVHQQISKAKGLDKKMNWKKEEMVRKGVLDFCKVSMPPHKGSKSVSWFLEKYGVTQEQLALTNIPNAPDAYQMFVEFNRFFQEVKCVGVFSTVKRRFKRLFSDIKVAPNWARGIMKTGKRESTEVRLSETPIDVKPVATLIFNENGYKQHCKKWKEYTDWLKNRNTARYVDINEHGQQIDGKNMLHCCRLLDMGVEISEGKGIIVRRPNAEYLLSIRKGKVDLEKIYQDSKVNVEKMKAGFKTCDLPDEVSQELVDKILWNIRKSQVGALTAKVNSEA